jgi:hypothetical protein
MTVWLDVGWVETNIPHSWNREEEYRIEDHGVRENGRAAISVVFPDGLKLADSGEISDWSSILNGLRTGNPEIQIEARAGNVVVTVETDENCYRES